MTTQGIVESAKLPPVMTAQEQETQRRSFAYGNCKIGHDNITREMVDAVAEAMKSNPIP
jgi:hypothetical protein